MTFLSTMTTFGIELFQSLWSTTFHGGSVFPLLDVLVRSPCLIFVAGMVPLFATALPEGILPASPERHIGQMYCCGVEPPC
jgi:hypothetical protein